MRTIFKCIAALLFTTSGCATWKQSVQAIDGTTKEPIGDVRITWIAAHRRFMEYTKESTEFTTAMNGIAFLEYRRNNYPFNVIIFEHPKYYDAALGVVQKGDGVWFRLNTPAPVSNMPWLRTSAQESSPSTNVTPVITKDYEEIEVLPVIMFPR